ncbi:MAG: hypothetical protein U0X20_09990 [Caldilineaceae bacterium]
MRADSGSQEPRSGSLSGADELNWAHYFGVLRRRWQEILLVTLAVAILAAAGVLLYRQITPPVYEATATAAIVRTASDVSLDERFTTSSDPLASQSINSRRTALVALVKSGEIAQQVIDELGNQLPPGLQSPAALLNTVTADAPSLTTGGATTQSDLIQINVHAGSPELAAAIANAWAKAYVRQVNSIYGQVPDDMLSSVEAQLVEAQSDYQKAQTSLESYLATSQLNMLMRQSEVVSDTLSILQQAQVDSLKSYIGSVTGAYSNIVQTYVASQADNQVLAFNKEQDGQRARVAAYLDAFNAAQVDTFTEQNDRYRSELRIYYDQWLRTNSLLAAARTLQTQVAAGDISVPSSALALQVLNVQLVNAAAAAPPQPSTQYLSPGTQQQNPLEDQQQNPQQNQPVQTTPLQIQLDASNIGSTSMSAADLRKQVDATVASLESQLATLEQNINKLNQSLLNGDGFQDLNAAVPADSALSQAITSAYPALFQSNVFSTTDLQLDSSPLLAAGQAQAAKFLALAEEATLPTANSSDAPMSATVDQLEEQLRALQGQIEVERSRNLQFTQNRDLAWESVKVLSNKQAELQLARAAADSEVRISGLAVPIDEPLPLPSLFTILAFAATVGILLGIIIAFVRDFSHTTPLHVPRPHRMA